MAEETAPTTPSSETPATGSSIQEDRAELAAALASVRKAIGEIDELKGKATVALNELLESRAKADGEARHAHTAKGHTEAHAAAVAGLKGEADTLLGSVRVAAKEIEESRSVVQNARTSADSDLKLAQEARKTAEVDVSTAKTKYAEDSSRISEVRKLAESDADAIGKALKAVQSSEGQVTSTAEASDKAWAKVQDLQGKITQAHVETTQHLEQAKHESNESVALKKSLADIVGETKTFNAQVQEFKKSLEGAIKGYGELHAKVESLLPQAASASLASAFREQRDLFAKKQTLWQFLQLGCITAIAALVTIVTWRHLMSSQVEEWDVIVRSVIAKLPVLGALVWLALVAGHHFSLNLRLAEDYAYKAALSTAFEGYKREMTEMSSVSGPALDLCRGVLLTLQQPPGRIYDSKQSQVTPLTVLTDLLKELKSKKVDVQAPTTPGVS